MNKSLNHICVVQELGFHFSESRSYQMMNKLLLVVSFRNGTKRIDIYRLYSVKRPFTHETFGNSTARKSAIPNNDMISYGIARDKDRVSDSPPT